jgi:hypothetical protein
MSGTVNISRDIWGDECFKSEPFTEREAFMWLIMEASWKQRTKRVGDYIVNLDRGQAASSVRFMAKAWGWTPAKVQRFVDRLKKLKKITVKTDTGVSVVTVCKYDDYQSKPKAGDTPPIQDRYRTDTNENKGLIPDATSSSVSRSKPQRFQEFWDNFPHRNGAKKKRKEAEGKYAKAVAAGVPEQILIAAAIRYRNDAQVLRGYGSGPVPWLNGEMWNDDIEQLSPNPPTRNGGGSTGHDSLMAGFAQSAHPEPSAGGSDFDGSETAFGSHDAAMGGGQDCYPSQPLLRVIGSE